MDYSVGDVGTGDFTSDTADLWKQTAGQHRFGGSHTDDKTARVCDYLSAFNVALQTRHRAAA